MNFIILSRIIYFVVVVKLLSRGILPLWQRCQKIDFKILLALHGFQVQGLKSTAHGTWLEEECLRPNMHRLYFLLVIIPWATQSNNYLRSMHVPSAIISHLEMI